VEFVRSFFIKHYTYNVQPVLKNIMLTVRFFKDIRLKFKIINQFKSIGAKAHFYANQVQGKYIYTAMQGRKGQSLMKTNSF
jgi:hypothetical protein